MSLKELVGVLHPGSFAPSGYEWVIMGPCDQIAGETALAFAERWGYSSISISVAA